MRDQRAFLGYDGVEKSGCISGLDREAAIFNTQNDYVDKSGSAVAQFFGRIEKFVALPDQLPIADLEKLLAHQCLVEIKSPLKRWRITQTFHRNIWRQLNTRQTAVYLAHREGRDKPEWADIQRAMRGSISPQIQLLQ